MAEPSIARLGHVGLFCHDVAAEKAFFCDILGLKVSDEMYGMVFLGSHPEREHHDIVLRDGRRTPVEEPMLQQLSFRCDRLEDVVGYYRRFKQHGVKIQQVVNHGLTVSVYFHDPEGNRCEVYWYTNLPCPKPFVEKIDLDQPTDEIMRQVEAGIRIHGSQGYMDPSLPGQGAPASK